jgi:hypothetical protein
LIFQWCLTFVVKGFKEDVVDQIVHRLATAAVSECDSWYTHFPATPSLTVVCCYF